MKRILAIILAAAAALAALAQESDAMPQGLTAAKCFLAMPEEMLQMLPEGTRLDMLDYAHAGSDRASANELDGPARILSEEPHSLIFQYGLSDTVQIFVLNPTATSPLIGVIHTFATPILDSNVQIYTPQWQPAPLASRAPTLYLDDWLAKKAARRLVEESLPYILASAAYDPHTQTLTYTNSMAAYFYGDEGKDTMAALRPSLTFKWTGSKFAPAK